MKRIIITLFSITSIAIALAGCAQSQWLYRVNVQQGNVITGEYVRKLHKGMTKDMVCELLGPPVLMDPFNDNRWTYIYTYKPGKGKAKCIDRHLTLYFRNNCLVTTAIRNITD
jgi:outer membrane protein assembly factor BamE